MATLRPFALLLLLLSLALPAESPPVKEYQVKAVFLYNFAQFVQWPADALPADSSPFVVGILGDDPFNSYLDEVVRGESVNGHPLKVVRYGSLEDVKDCHVLFVSASETPRLEPILRTLKSRRILTVGEHELFSRLGGMVSFVTKQGKIRFRINLDAVQAADLTVSSKLLRLAEIVGPRKG
jgi:hypothetical protein